jgi:hypothetical protein
MHADFYTSYLNSSNHIIPSQSLVKVFISINIYTCLSPHIIGGWINSRNIILKSMKIYHSCFNNRWAYLSTHKTHVNTYNTNHGLFNISNHIHNEYHK